MRFAIAWFVIVGLVGAVMLLMDEERNWFGLHDTSRLVKKIKQEQDAFVQFCRQRERAATQKNNSVPVVAAPAPACAPSRCAVLAGGGIAQSPFGKTAAKVSFVPQPFGKIDFHHLGDYQPSGGAPSGPSPVAPPATSGTVSQAKRLQSSSNPIIKTWAGYVSMLEDAAK